MNKLILSLCGGTGACGIYKIEYKNSIYIGQTIKMGHRWDTHLSTLRNNKHDNNRLQNICNKYGINNLTFSVVEFCKESELTNKEQFWADFYKKDKEYDVLNIGKFVDSPMRGRNHTQKTREKISNSKKGKFLSEKHKRNIGKGNKGKVITEATRRKFSESTKGEKHYNYGKHLSTETRKKISETQKGRVKSRKECKRISESKMGHEVSEETRRKISKSLMGNINRNKGKNYEQKNYT